MSIEHLDDVDGHDGMSRRNLFTGAAAAATAGAIVGGVATATASASALPPRPLAAPSVAALAVPGAGLSFLPIDCVDFFTPLQSAAAGRYSDNTSGTGVLSPPDSLYATIPLPVGSVIHQISVSYQGQPIVFIQRRSFVTPNPPTEPFGPLSLAAGGGPKLQTLDLATPVTIEAAASYAFRVFCSAGASIYGITIGYVPPTQTFTPFTGGDPRVLDTRTSVGKLAPDEERTINLGFVGARAAVFNLAIVNTENAGFVACFPANVGYPGNASINWSTSNSILSNGVICGLDASGAIKIRGGANRTDVVIDRIGFFV